MLTTIGFIFSILLFGVALFNSGGFKVFFDVTSIIIVLGGTIAATLIAYPLEHLFRIFKVFQKAFTSNSQEDLNKIIVNILKCAVKSRKESFLALEDMIKDIDEELLQKGLLLIIEGFTADNIRSILELEIENQQDRHAKGESLFRFMSKLAPAFGMIGTLIGLIAMLKGLGTSSADSLGPSMAVALITTFYGAMLSNLLFTPIAEKLSNISEEEYLRNLIIKEGVLMIYDGINPRIIEKKLHTFIPKKYRESFIKRVKNV